MSEAMHEATRLAGAALESAINSAKTTEEQIRVAEMFVVLGTNFLRALFGEDHAREFLQKGIDDLKHPAVMNVIRVADADLETSTKH